MGTGAVPILVDATELVVGQTAMGGTRMVSEQEILFPELDRKIQEFLKWFFETLVRFIRGVKEAWRTRPSPA